MSRSRVDDANLTFAQARTLRRAVTNENDENSSIRMTRAKAAATGPDAVKKPLRAKTSISNVQQDAIPRKRTALGDMSNVNKADHVESKENKKPLPLSKAAQPLGVQKLSRTNSTRSVLGPKDKNTVSNDLKRSASVASQGEHVTKKRATNSNSARRSQSLKEEPSLKEEYLSDENADPESANAGVKVRTETTRTKTTYPDGRQVEQEVEKKETVLPEVKLSAKDIQLQQTIEAMDEEDLGDPLMVGEYVYEVLDYMKELEVTTAPNPDYMDGQNELEWRMRGVLVDWLLEVHTRFHLLPETLYLTINIIDRFLSRKFVHLERLQLVGITAMFIAAKYEEVLSPHIANFSHVADDGFSDEEILSAERYILATLNYDLSFPNPMHFMRRISKADNYDIHTRTIAKYLLEISLLDERFLEFLPSVNAAAAMQLSRIILNKGSWVCLLPCFGVCLHELTFS